MANEIEHQTQLAAYWNDDPSLYEPAKAPSAAKLEATDKSPRVKRRKLDVKAPVDLASDPLLTEGLKRLYSCSQSFERPFPGAAGDTTSKSKSMKALVYVDFYSVTLNR